jgi:riboflavin kinase/FMN adenylyltransferase
VVDCVAELGEKVSSTRIEEELAKGDTLEAGKMLGHWHSIPGIVAAGFQRGSKLLNFPTANLEAEPGHVLPAGGVYAGEVLVDGKWHPAMINIGSNPTFGNKKASVEAHILNYSGDLYGKRVRFAFGPRLRDEQKFPDFQALKAQLEKDVKRTPLVLEEQKDLCAASHKFWSF